MAKKLSVLMAQINPLVGAIKINCEKIISIIEANQHNYDIILFPELALTGYPPEDLLFRPEFLQLVDHALKAIAAATTNCHVLVGHPCQENNDLFNTVSVFHNQQRINYYHKQVLPNYGVFDERRYFCAGMAKACVLTINDYQVGLCICEDIWQQAPIDNAIAAGAQIILCINASPFDYTKQATREKLLENQAKKGVAIVYVNLVGGQDGLLFDGQSLAVNAQGKLCARLPAFEECYQPVFFENDKLTGEITPLQSVEQQIYNALVLGLRDYVEKNHFSGVLLGLSGGIDSALTLAIAVDALGPQRVHAVMMPSRYTAALSIDEAKAQIDKLGVKSSLLSIEPAFQSFLSTLEPCFQGLPTDITEENLQARIRGVLLMALSNKTGKMVLTTSNKSESAVGYSTLYGDMVGGYAVIQDVLKTQVYALSHYRNSISPVIPEKVITRAPSAELAENQTDQDSLPPYEILDGIIKGYMENNQSEIELIQAGFPSDDVRKVIRLIKRNEYKRRQAAPGTKISPRAFDRDWRYPISSGF